MSKALVRPKNGQLWRDDTYNPRRHPDITHRIVVIRNDKARYFPHHGAAIEGVKACRVAIGGGDKFTPDGPTRFISLESFSKSYSLFRDV